MLQRAEMRAWGGLQDLRYFDMWSIREVDPLESEDLIHEFWSCFPEMDASGNSGWRVFQYTDMRTWHARSHIKEL